MKRPRIISLICIAGYLSVLFSFPEVFSPGIKKLGVMMPAIYGVLVASHFISCVGIWYYKKWGVELYLLTFFSRTLFFMLTAQTGAGFYIGLVVSAVFIVILLRHYSRMNANL